MEKSMNPLTEAIEKELRKDSLADAEIVTGKSYKDDAFTGLLGMALMLENNKNRQALLELTGDTSYGTSAEDYIKIAGRIGFNVVYQEEFYSTKWNQKDAYYILFHEKGLLLFLETFGLNDKDQKTVNTARCYFNWKSANPDKSWPTIPVSGGLSQEYVFVGDFHALEALIHNFTILDNEGKFVWPWVFCPHLWLITYEEPEAVKDEKNFKVTLKYYDKIIKQRLSKLPQEIQSGISERK